MYNVYHYKHIFVWHSFAHNVTSVCACSLCAAAIAAAPCAAAPCAGDGRRGAPPTSSPLEHPCPPCFARCRSSLRSTVRLRRASRWPRGAARSPTAACSSTTVLWMRTTLMTSCRCPVSARFPTYPSTYQSIYRPIPRARCWAGCSGSRLQQGVACKWLSGGHALRDAPWLCKASALLARLPTLCHPVPAAAIPSAAPPHCVPPPQKCATPTLCALATPDACSHHPL